jgi:(1->4)-alpha-D-glucan 1-alpha-D-glucosylmutase
VNEPSPLGSTYRLQLNGLGFVRARQLVAYLDELGVETLYLSPILEAVPGSTHGYDVINPTRLDPALGTPEQFEELLVELAARGMRVLIDIVPNHMACDESNTWWWDVLRLGQGSQFAPTFDIDWSRHVGRVLVPTLAAPLSDLESSITYVGEGPDRAMEVGEQRFPLAPGTHTASDLGTVLARQHYRPAFWRLSNHEGNYRRFFDIDGLIGVRVEVPDVFSRTHDFLIALGDDERIAGWRVDHIDGLTDPSGYLERLRQAVLDRRETRPVVLVEKILARDEKLRASWQTDGTTGYEFADVAGGLFVSPRGARQLADAGSALVSADATFEVLGRRAKREALRGSFDASLERLARLSMHSLNEMHPGHDLSWFDVRRALTEITVSLDVYRTYFTDSLPDDDDRERLLRATQSAMQTLVGESRRAVELIADVIGSSRGVALELVQRWQQLSAADMAKGVEDTTTYRYCGLLSHAEVGCDPDDASADPLLFHQLAAEHLTRPLTLNATSTHDSKRSEDSRARLFTLSEVSDEWNALVLRWHKRYRSETVGTEDELRAYQSFVCLWPSGSARLPRSIVRRIQDYAVKAARESKLHTSWTDPLKPYEQNLRTFIARLAGDERFDREMSRFVSRVGPAAITNSLATTVLKCVAPGVPDFYQGTELFDFTLTDPDNRRPVDFARRQALLSRMQMDETAPPTALGAAFEDGDGDALKLSVTRELLHLRRNRRELFAYGDYQPLVMSGRFKNHAVAFARHHEEECVIACVPRLTISVVGAGRYALGSVWDETKLRLSPDSPTQFVDLLTGIQLTAKRDRLDLSECFATLPVSVLVNAN